MRRNDQMVQIALIVNRAIMNDGTISPEALRERVTDSLPPEINLDNQQYCEVLNRFPERYRL